MGSFSTGPIKVADIDDFSQLIKVESLRLGHLSNSPKPQNQA
jgi:hypothetical protein